MNEGKAMYPKGNEGAEPAARLKIGGRYNWKGQPERLIYLGLCEPRNGRWHQFGKLGAGAAKVWCEVLDSDLHRIEESEGAEPADERLTARDREGQQRQRDDDRTHEVSLPEPAMWVAEEPKRHGSELHAPLWPMAGASSPPVHDAYVAIGSTRFSDGQLQTEESFAAAQMPGNRTEANPISLPVALSGHGDPLPRAPTSGAAASLSEFVGLPDAARAVVGVRVADSAIATQRAAMSHPPASAPEPADSVKAKP